MWEAVVPTALVIAVLCVVICMQPDQSRKMPGDTFAFIPKNLGAGCPWFNLFLTGLDLLFIFSRHGNVKFGAKDEAPAFSNGKWISMMFCAGVAGAAMF